MGGQREVLKGRGWGWEVLKSGEVGERYQGASGGGGVGGRYRGVEVPRRRGVGG